MSQQAEWHRTGFAAEIYERDLVPTIFGPWAVELLTRADPHLGERVLDVACGTGAVTRLAARAVGAAGHMVGLDTNGAMLRVAMGVPQPFCIEWVEGSAVALPFVEQRFDLVLCQQGLQYFPDRAAALAEMRRVLRPGGRLALSVWRSIDHSPAFLALARALSRCIGPAAGVLPPFALDDAEEVPRLVAAAGFRDVTDEVVARTLLFPSSEAFVERYVAGSPLAATPATVDAAARAAFAAEAVMALQPYVDLEGLTCPMAARIVTARR